MFPRFWAHAKPKSSISSLSNQIENAKSHGLKTPDWYNWGNPDNALHRRSDLRRGKKELEAFAIDTFNSLCAEEERKAALPSRLRVFARLDIGLMSVGNSLGYFVNEVERSWGTSLFTHSGSFGQAIQGITLLLEKLYEARTHD